MERTENELRISFNEWFEQFCKDKDGNVMMLTVGDIWEAWLAGAKVGGYKASGSDGNTFEYVKGMKLRGWNDLDEEERQELSSKRIHKDATLIPQRAINALSRHGVTTYAQLVQLSRMQLTRMSGIARGSLSMIKKDLETMGLSLMPCYLDHLDEE